jgi:hypothetical protein
MQLASQMFPGCPNRPFPLRMNLAPYIATIHGRGSIPRRLVSDTVRTMESLIALDWRAT